MKKTSLCMFVLACAIGAMAQATSSGDSMKQDKMAGKKTTLTGCIVEKGGRFLLADAKHPDGVELATSEDLKAHVGHKVRVTGTMGNAMTKGDKMGHDSMAKDDKMGHDSMGKDDKMSHDSMGKDDKMSHDSMAKDDKMSHDSMGMEHSAMALNVSSLEMRSATCTIKK